jgi:DNA topoisomerase-1
MVSPELSRQSGERLSAGRVQSPAVRLVVERERQIRAFKVTNHFGAMLFFADAKTQGEWSAEWLTKPDFVTDDNPYFMDRAFAAAVAETSAVVVGSFNEGEAKRSPPPPFTTSTMQQAASVALSLNPKAAMDTAQKLYEQGHITYHRTDNPNVSDDSLGDIYAVAVKLGLDMAESPRKFKAPEGAQVGHPAITPTHWDVEVAGETDEQKSLYKLIRLRAIACQLADARYAVRTARLQGAQPVGGKNVEFEAKGRTLTYPGWLKLTAGDQTDAEGEDEEPPNPIPFLEAGQRLDVTHGKLLDKKTKPPSRYTEATLVKKLESEGIGRPATYAAITENIVSRAYVRVEKKHLVPTDTGELVVDSLAGKFAFMDLGFTRDVEEDLDRIAQGQAGYKGVITKVHEQLQRELATMEVTAPKHPCPNCGKALGRRKGEFGFFWSCSGYPDCKTRLPDDDGKPGKPKAPPPPTGFQCPKCGKELARRQGIGKPKAKGEKGKPYDFYGCTGFPKCDGTYQTGSDEKPDFEKSK